MLTVGEGSRCVHGVLFLAAMCAHSSYFLPGSVELRDLEDVLGVTGKPTAVAHLGLRSWPRLLSVQLGLNPDAICSEQAHVAIVLVAIQ